MSNGNSAEASTSPSPAPSSIGNSSAPKFGTLVPNRVFVGGISANTTEQDLLDLFGKYGKVKATKVISDRAGVSKGYGFVTFETEDEARKLTQEADNIMLKDRKLNIAPAIKKQVSDLGYIKPYSPRLVDGGSAPAVIGTNGAVFFGNGASYGYPNPMSMLTSEYHQSISTGVPQAPSTQHTATYPTQQAPQTTHSTVSLPSHHPVVSHSAASQYHTQFVYPQPLYFPHQYQSPVVQPQWATAASPQWRWVSPTSYGQCLADSYGPVGHVFGQSSQQAFSVNRGTDRESEKIISPSNKMVTATRWNMDTLLKKESKNASSTSDNNGILVSASNMNSHKSLTTKTNVSKMSNEMWLPSTDEADNSNRYPSEARNVSEGTYAFHPQSGDGNITSYQAQHFSWCPYHIPGTQLISFVPGYYATMPISAFPLDLKSIQPDMPNSLKVECLVGESLMTSNKTLVEEICDSSTSSIDTPTTILSSVSKINFDMKAHHTVPHPLLSDYDPPPTSTISTTLGNLTSLSSSNPPANISCNLPSLSNNFSCPPPSYPLQFSYPPPPFDKKCLYPPSICCYSPISPVQPNPSCSSSMRFDYPPILQPYMCAPISDDSSSSTHSSLSNLKMSIDFNEYKDVQMEKFVQDPKGVDFNLNECNMTEMAPVNFAPMPLLAHPPPIAHWGVISPLPDDSCAFLPLSPPLTPMPSDYTALSLSNDAANTTMPIASDTSVDLCEEFFN